MGAFKQVSLNPEIRPLLLMFFLYQVAFFVYPIIWSYFTTERFGWSESTIGLSLAMFGISMALVQGGLIRVVLRRLGDRGTVLFGLVFSIFSFLVIAFVPDGAIVLMFTPITALGAVVTPALQGILSKATSDDSQGELQGVLASIGSIALVGSPLVMTATFSAFTANDTGIFLPGAPFLLAAVLSCVCLAILLTTPRADRG